MATSFVKYVGTSHRRIISADDWKADGFKNGETSIWDWENAFSIPADKFTEDQIQNVLLAHDGDFVIMTGEDHAPRKLPKQTGEQNMLGRTIGVNLGGQVKPTAPATDGK
jgi:hypothetical protein